MPYTTQEHGTAKYLLTRGDAITYFPWAKTEALHRTGQRMEDDRVRGGAEWSIPFHNHVFLQILATLLGGTPHNPCPQTSTTDAEAWLDAQLAKPGGEVVIPGSCYQAYILRHGKRF